MIHLKKGGNKFAPIVAAPARRAAPAYVAMGIVARTAEGKLIELPTLNVSVRPSRRVKGTV